MNIRNFTFLMLFSILLSSCFTMHKSENINIVNYWIGKKIELPLLKNNKYNENYKIITRINGNCYTCITQLKDWKLFIDEVTKKNKISFLIFLVANDTSLFNSINRNDIHFNYPIIYDKDNILFKENKFPQNSIYHTMLLDKDNKVILIGNPLMNPALKRLYIKEIAKQKIQSFN